MSVTFTQKLQFKSKMVLETINDQPPQCSYQNTRPRHNKPIIFEPRYYKHIGLNEKGFVFTDRKKPKNSVLQKGLEPIQKIISKDLEPIQNKGLEPISKRLEPIQKKSLEPISKGSKKTFRSHFKPLRVCDVDLIDKARDSLLFSSHPYRNYKPYQHREEVVGFHGDWTTRKTPDPYNIKFENAIITNQQHDCDYTWVHPPVSPILTIGPNINARLSRRPLLYSTNLYFPKGNYTPAYTAHNAYLDRIAKSLTK